MELYRGEPLIRSVRKLAISPADEAGFAPVAIVVSLADRDDYIFASSDGSVERTVEGGFVFAGRFGYFSERKNGERQISLVGGSRLTRNGAGIRSEGPGEFRARIAAVDHKQNRITISPAPADPESLTGKTLYITNPSRRLALKVESVGAPDRGRSRVGSRHRPPHSGPAR